MLTLTQWVQALFGLTNLCLSVAALSHSLRNSRRALQKDLEAAWQDKLQTLDTRWDEKMEGMLGWQRDADGLIRSQGQAIAVLQNQIAVFWRGVGYNASQVLHSPHTPEFDRLLERYNDRLLTPSQERELHAKLITLINDPTEDKLKRKAASEMLLVMRMEAELRAAMTAYVEQLHNIGYVPGQALSPPTQTPGGGNP